MKENKLKTLVEIAIFAALGIALDLLAAGMFRFAWPDGGSIGFAMVPIFIIAYRRGLLAGILCGLIVSVVQMLGGVYSINASSFDNQFMKTAGQFIQISLDYVLAYTVVGFAGIFSRMYKNGETKGIKALAIILGCVLGGLLKYACHVLAGGLFWLGNGSESFAGVANNTWLYSFVYNGSYCIPNIIICTAVMVLIGLFYSQFLKPVKKEKEDDIKESEVITNEEQI